MRIGIIFGGKSREREISFAGGRTVYDCLDKSIFTPVPIFIDSLGNLILLNWQNLYKGSIRDFYPPAKFTKKSKYGFQVYAESLENFTQIEAELIAETGKKINWENLKEHIDFAFLTLHGPYGEDGTVQGMLEFMDIPYTGAGIYPSATGINKAAQKELMKNAGFNLPAYEHISRDQWISEKNKSQFFKSLKEKLGFPIVVKSSSQGSSIGVHIVSDDNSEIFIKAVNNSLFIEEIDSIKWQKLSLNEKINHLKILIDINTGIGMPVYVNDSMLISDPDILFETIETLSSQNNETIRLESLNTEPELIFESFLKAKEFSCIVIRNENGQTLALPPTEIRKQSNIFDYRAKYLPGISRKVTPIELPVKQIEKIRSECCRLYRLMRCNTYARIDGFINTNGELFLNDPNTTSGMLPSSFFFHQAAEIGLTPTQFLTYIINASICERAETGYAFHKYKKMNVHLDHQISLQKKEKQSKIKIAVILGGYSTERHISVESGRNIFEKLASSEKYDPIPVFLSKKDNGFELHIIPVNLLLKDNADDIRDKIKDFKIPEIISTIIKEAEAITKKYTLGDCKFVPEKVSIDQLKTQCDAVFIALHGRPGEDGQIQKLLDNAELPYNGSGPEAAGITIDKHLTNKILKEKGFLVAPNILLEKDRWNSDNESILKDIKQKIEFPLIAKPSDDGCSSAVKKIKNESELKNYAEILFRKSEKIPEKPALSLGIKDAEEFPQKDFFLIEKLIEQNKAVHFLEITGGMLTHINKKGEIEYEMFEPSEAVAEEGVLSLEEKFLAGEGQNITPARFDPDEIINKKISEEVKSILKRVAQTLNIIGYCRIDAFVKIYDKSKIEVSIIEINSLPGMTPATCIFHQAAINNYKPYEYIDKIINFGIQHKKETLEIN